MTRRKRWLWRASVVLLVLLAADEGLSLVLSTARLRGYLTARLAAAFGRPVEVSRYHFSLLRGPSVDADFITVDEDPRFGQEYFLRADKLSVSLRWQSLLRGHVEFGTFSFARPSLNLARTPDGRWNLEDWLPPAPVISGAAAAPLAGFRQGAPLLYRVEIDGGRINFKRGVDKHPFALVDVSGRFDEESPGRWRIDLEARPMRAAVVLQDVGTVHLQGRVGGTSARLRPAQLQASWQDASLSDALRLFRGYDYGVRGQLAVELLAHSEGEKWSFVGHARLRNIHRWDFPLRPGSPAVNLHLAGDWWPPQARVELTQGLLEAPHSSIRAAGSVRWSRPFGSPQGAPRTAQLQVVSAGIHLADLLAWCRALHPGVADGLVAEGLVGIDAQLGGWPPRIERAVLAADGARLEGADGEGAIRMGRAVVQLRGDAARLSTVTFTLPKQAGTLRVGGEARRASGWRFQVMVVGKVERVQDVSQVVAAFGGKFPAAWNVDGPAGLALSWRGSFYPFGARATGSLDLRRAVWRVPFVNGAVDLDRVRIDLSPNERRITVGEARAFGAEWNGWLKRSDLSHRWEFNLTADRLDAGELGRWLTPERHETLLERIMPARNNSKRLDGWMDLLEGQGRLEAKQLLLAPLVLRRLRGRLEVDGRKLRLSDAQADFYGGTVSGSFRASLVAQPTYGAEARLERVNLGLLSAASPTLEGRFSGTAAGELQLAARGLGRENLLRSLEGRGRLEVRDAQDRELDWIGSLNAGKRRPGASAFRTASAEFRLAGGKIEFDQLRLVNTTAKLEGAGSIDFSRSFDLRIRVAAPAQGKAPAQSSSLLGRSFRVAGPLDALQIVRLGPTPAPR